MKRIFQKLFIIALMLCVLSACGTEHSDKPRPTSDPMPTEARVGFLACGDNIIYKGTVADAKSRASDGGYDFKPIYANVAELIADAELSFINQETVMCGEGYELSYYPTFNSPQKVGQDLVELGFDIINVANNHMLDKGRDGLLRTLDFWDTQDVLLIGGYRGRADFENLRIIEKNGIKLAFLSFTEMTNGIKLKETDSLFIPYTKDEDIVAQVKKAKETADFVVTSVHWGNEGQFVPSSEQRRLAQLIADSGGDVILGHHPHVIQPVEWLCGADGNRCLCVYSLGNFAAEQAYDYNMVGGIVTFDFVRGADGALTVADPVFNPTVYHFNGKFRDNSVHLMENYNSELASVHGVKAYYRNPISYERLLEYAKNTISAEFLPDSLK